MKAAFEIKSTRLDALSVHLFSDDPAAIASSLQQWAARFDSFRDMPFILDVQRLNNAPALDLGRIIAIFARYGLRIVGLRHIDPVWAETARQYRLAYVRPGEKKAADGASRQPEAAASRAPGEPDRSGTPAGSDSGVRPTVIIDRPVRTGQQVYAENADLIVAAPLSVGAEIIADGNIHVYGTLRGRVLAGAAGNRKARIFAQAADAELVSVAGIYRVFDTPLSAHLQNKPVQIYLQENSLIISPVSV